MWSIKINLHDRSEGAVVVVFLREHFNNVFSNKIVFVCRSLGGHGYGKSRGFRTNKEKEREKRSARKNYKKIMLIVVFAYVIRFHVWRTIGKIESAVEIPTKLSLIHFFGSSTVYIRSFFHDVISPVLRCVWNLPFCVIPRSRQRYDRLVCQFWVFFKCDHVGNLRSHVKVKLDEKA